MYSFPTAGASLLLGACFLGGAACGFLRADAEGGVFAGAAATVTAVSLFSFGLFAVYMKMGILLIWPWGILYAAITGGIGAYVGCRLRRLLRRTGQ